MCYVTHWIYKIACFNEENFLGIKIYNKKFEDI